MPIGSYTVYAELHRVISSRNELNEPEDTTELVEPFWCSVKLNSASENSTDDTLSNVSRYTLKTHFIPDADDTMRVYVNGAWYSIIGVESPFNSQTIFTVERSSDGRRV